MDYGDRSQAASDTFLRAALDGRRKRAAGNGRSECEDCGEEIPAERRKAVPGCTRCVFCQTTFEREG